MFRRKGLPKGFPQIMGPESPLGLLFSNVQTSIIALDIGITIIFMVLGMIKLESVFRKHPEALYLKIYLSRKNLEDLVKTRR